MLSDEQLRSIYDLGMRDDEHPWTGEMKGLRAVEAAVRADQIEKIRSTIGAYSVNGVWAFDQAVARIARAAAIVSAPSTHEQEGKRDA